MTAPVSERDAVRRLLQRVGLGPRPGELDAAAAQGFDATLARLTSSTVPDPGVAVSPAPPSATPGLTRGDRQLSPEQRRATRQQEKDRVEQLSLWWLDRMAAVEAPYPERLVFFWHGHFATSVKKVKSAALMLTQNETFRRLGGGDFRDLARALVVDPAMLVWLDGGGNRRGKPNENLSRELMELFMLGVGHYGEADVREGARALTGWRVDRATDSAAFVPQAHDGGPQTVLGSTGSFDAPGLVELLAAQPASPQFLAGRVWRRFVSDTPPEPATLNSLVAGYGPGRDITGLLRAAVGAPAFRDPGSVLVRQPMEWLVGALRALRLRPSAMPATAQQAVRTGLVALGQVPFAPPDVGGWPSGSGWLTTTASLARLRIAQALASAGDIGAVAEASPGARADAAAALLGLPAWTDRTRAALTPLARQPAQLVALALASPENTVSA